MTVIFIFLKWEKLSQGYHRNYSFFDIFFILIYPFEEIVFLVLYYFEPNYRGLWVSGIVLVLCSTLILDKWLLKKQHSKSIKVRLSKERKLIVNYIKTLDIFGEKIKNLEKDNKKLLDYGEKLTTKLKKLEKHRPK